ncbi:hypothetical protein [Haloarcula salina]|uniref:Uncharacterized protein n=1 Tax=Haloarcula salina TaxID=1429914 RepID=A0AA41KMI7_9EURY|nr:hypothetical protein [Haloarcula salina]MBV0903939.1 hypothetical protein [Haloarcula salina]
MPSGPMQSPDGATAEEYTFTDTAVTDQEDVETLEWSVDVLSGLSDSDDSSGTGGADNEVDDPSDWMGDDPRTESDESSLSDRGGTDTTEYGRTVFSGGSYAGSLPTPSTPSVTRPSLGGSSTIIAAAVAVVAVVAAAVSTGGD